MTIWTAVNSAAIAVLGLALFLMVRQVGLILQRVGPTGARGLSQGPRIGENISSFLGQVGWAPSVPGVVIFGSKVCPICSVIDEASRHLAPHWAGAAQVMMVYDTPRPDEVGQDRDSRNFRVAFSEELRRQLAVNALPYAVAVNEAGIVLAHGLVNNESHVESLLETIGRTDLIAPPPAEDTADERKDGVEVA